MNARRIINDIAMCLEIAGATYASSGQAAERTTGAMTAPAVPTNAPHRPNILWIMADQIRYDCVGSNGNRIIKTPHLDRLAAKSANHLIVDFTTFIDMQEQEIRLCKRNNLG